MSLPFEEIEGSLRANGLYILGHFSIADGETVLSEQDDQPEAMALIGNAGSSIWPSFDAAREERPGLTLDRWTEETVGGIADRCGVKALYPFDGPPFSAVYPMGRQNPDPVLLADRPDGASGLRPLACLSRCPAVR